MDFNKRFQMIPSFIRKSGLIWGDSSKNKRRILWRILKIYDILYRKRNKKSQRDYVTEHWVKYPSSEE